MLLNVFDSINTFFETFGIQIIECIAIFVIGLFVIRTIKSLLKRATKKSQNKTLVNFFISCLNVFLYVVLIYAIFAILGISTTSFLALLSAAGLAVALALKDSLSNLANGVIIVTTKPFIEGDYIQVNGVEGTVKSVQMFVTKIITIDNKEITIPNSQIISNEVINYSARTTRRIDLEVYVAYESDIEKTKRVLLDVMNKHPKLAKNPAPFCRLSKYDESSLAFKTKAWTSTANYWDCYHDLLEQFIEALRANGIKVPYTTREIYLHNDKEESQGVVNEENIA